MTDKVQKIKDWICREQDGLMDAQGNFENPSDEGAFHILTNLDYYIDSLQEEPVIQNVITEPVGVPANAVELANIPDEVELIHRRIEEIKANTKDKQFASPYNTGRVDLCNELLSLIDSVKEEPKDPCKDPQYIQELKDKLNSMSKEEFDKEWDKCKPDEEEPSIPEVYDEHWYEMLKKEPVSEDLENAGKEWLRPQLDKHYKPYGEGKMMELTRFDGYAMLDAIEFGAKWQKQKDDEMLTAVYMNGVEEGKKQLMKDAGVAEYWDNWLILDPYLRGSFADGDKVKVIILKQEEK